MSKKKLISAVAILLLVIMGINLGGYAVVEANTGKELKDQIRELQEQQKDLKNQADNVKEELTDVEKEIQATTQEMQALDEEMAITNSNIEQKQHEITVTEVRIAELKEEISLLEERIAQRDELIKSRARHMYKNGGVVSYLEVILGARSFGDLIERVTAVSQIARQDRNILEQHFNDKNAVEAAKESLEEDLAMLEEQMADLEQLKAKLDEQLNEKHRLILKLEEYQDELLEEIISIEEEEKIIKEQEKAAQQELKRWEEEQRRLEEERRRAEAAKQNPGQNTGKLFRPANGRITSGFGWRIHPITGRDNHHNGIDFGRDRGRDIYAAADGTVSLVGYMGSYGNTIIITHVIDGQPLHTLYAHLAASDVTVGQQVKRGQRIATMGTTGSSTGIHLHFEVRTGMGWNNSKIQNPLNYLN